MSSFEKLSEKIHTVLEKYTEAKQEKERIEAQMVKKEREVQEVKKRLERALKERDMVRIKLDGIIEKIDGLDIV